MRGIQGVFGVLVVLPLAAVPAAAQWTTGALTPPARPQYQSQFTFPDCNFAETSCTVYYPDPDPNDGFPPPTYAYWDYADQSYYQDNQANPKLWKQVWFHVVLDTDWSPLGTPPKPRPEIGTSFGAVVTPTGMSFQPWDGASTNLYFTWKIRPQPDSETIKLAGLGLPLDHVSLLEIATSCVPEPGSWAMLIAGFGLMGAVQRQRRVLAA